MKKLDTAPSVDHSDNDPQSWARKINLSMASSVAAIIETGRNFIEAKEKLGHGQFERLFANHADPLPEPVACSYRMANKFMSVARNAVLTKVPHAAVFPHSIETLYELSRVPDDKLELALQEGWIRPEMQRGDVKELREDQTNPRKKRTSPSNNDLQPMQENPSDKLDIDAIPNATEQIERVIKNLIYRLPPTDQQQLLLAVETLVSWFRNDLRKTAEMKNVEGN